MYERFGKRLIDILLSAALIVLLSPVYAVIALLVRVKMGRPVLFSQERIGRGEKPFRMYKFRTMTDARGADGALLDEQQRLTKFGVALRSSSLDELPELFSILRGDMSFVGPRPLPTYYGPYFLPQERTRHTVRGGLIPPDGLCGETTPSWETQFRYDVDYARHVSFALDCRVILATVKILFKRVENNYGAEDRPHLSEYRAQMRKDEHEL